MYSPTLSLIASFFAMAFVSISYFTKRKEHYLLFQLLCIVFLIISYFFNLQFFAMVGIAIGGFRALTFYIIERKNKQASILLSILFAFLTLLAYFIVNLKILKTANPLDILYLVGLVAFAFIFRIRNLKIVRFSMIIPIALSILFNILTHAPVFTILSYAFEFSANIVSIFKYHVFGKDK